MAQPGDHYLRLIDPIWSRLDWTTEESFLASVSRLSSEQGHLLAAHLCHEDVCNGGFNQFFINPAGVIAPEAVEGLRALGLEGAARVVQRAIDQFPQPYPRDQLARNAILRPAGAEIPDDARREDWDPFYSLDADYYAAVDFNEGGFERAADAYALTAALDQEPAKPRRPDA